ncbi:MAG: type IV pili sensor histidine kinase and response regulator, partial [bacterium]
LEEQGRARVEAGPLTRTARRLRGAEDDSGEPPPPKPEAGAPEVDARDAGQRNPREDAAPSENEGQDQRVAIGPHELPAELFHIFTDEAAQRLQALREALAEMAKGHRPSAWENFIRAAHTLAGISRTTGFAPLAEAAHAVELWAGRWPDKTLALTADANALLEEILGLLRESVAGILERRFPEAQPRIAQALAELDAAAAATESVPLAVVETPASPRAVDELDEQLLPVFLEEAHELMPRIGETLRAWRADPAAIAPRDELKRALHTLKGSSRMAGAMVLGEAVHALETRILGLGGAPAGPAFIDEVEAEYDRHADLNQQLRGGELAASAAPPRRPSRQRSRTRHRRTRFSPCPRRRPSRRKPGSPRRSPPRQSRPRRHPARRPPRSRARGVARA